jgi:hypothetical protein
MAENEFVNVQISIDVSPITAAGFGRGMFVYEEAAASQPAGFGGNRTKLYTSAAEVLDDFSSSDPAYLAAVAYFLPNTAPRELVIGLKLDTDASWTEGLDAINAESLGADSFGVAIDSAVEATILEVSTWAAVNDKQYFAKTADAGVPNQAITDDVASDLLTANSDQTSIFYWDGAATEYLEVEVLGAFLARDPGQFDVMGYQYKGVYTNTLTNSEKAVLKTKRVSYITSVSGANFIAHGFSSRTGYFADMYRNRLYLKARMEEAGIALLVRDILPGDDTGGALIYEKFNEVLSLRVSEGVIRSDYTLVVPKASDRPSQDRADRIWGDITFTANLVGAVNSLEINGTLVV